jgi:hypothetical protein
LATTGQRPTKAELAYLAGYIDGEGCFFAGIYSNGVQRKLSITNTYPDTLRRLVELFGGRYRKRKTRESARQQWEFVVGGRAADRCAKKLLPFLQEKRKQAELFIELGRWPQKSATCSALVAQLKALKRIQYDA